jgi:hypothetical protein
MQNSHLLKKWAWRFSLKSGFEQSFQVIQIINRFISPRLSIFGDNK